MAVLTILQAPLCFWLCRSLRMAAPEEAGEEEGGGANRELFVLDP